MQIFINETSLNSQFADDIQFFNSLKIFLSSLNKINEIVNNKSVFKSHYLFYYTGIAGTHFETTLKSNHILNTAFSLNLEKANPQIWQNQQLHDNHSTYTFKDIEYVGTSVAELAERKHQDGTLVGFLLNFSDSHFGNDLKIGVLKNMTDSIVIDCAISSESIEQWLIDSGYIDPNEVYDENSGISPTDHQTVLRDTSIFERTNYPRNKGRVVYRRIGTDELWAVDSDNRHANVKAHIEVFNETTGEHIGTSLYNAVEVRTAFKKRNRRIEIG